MDCGSAGAEIVGVNAARALVAVSRLMGELFDYLKGQKKNLLIVSSVFHYEAEFIHPFSDGNGRIGRLWHHALLVKHHPFFEFIPVESVIKQYQKEYYDSLHLSDVQGESTPFIEFCLKTLWESAHLFLEELKPEPLTTESRLERAREHFQKQTFSRKDYLRFFKTLSTATASRDLQQGVTQKALKKSGDKAQSTY